MYILVWKNGEDIISWPGYTFETDVVEGHDLGEADELCGVCSCW